MERLINRLAEASHSPPAKVADDLDKLITRIKKRFREGRPTRLPGLGTFEPGAKIEFRQEGTDAKRRSRHGRVAGPNR